MDAVLSRPLVVVGIVVVLVAVLVGVQAVASATAPADSVASTGKLLGSTGFAYLGGLRVFVAAVMWNRLEPQFDRYYETKRLQDLTFLMPTFYLVQKLNPNFEQAYYNAAFILGMRKQWGEAFNVAKEGIANNPKSGLLRANYAQVLLLQDNRTNLSRALEQAKAGMAADTTFQNADDEFESLAIFRTVFTLAGEKGLEAVARERLDVLSAQGAQPSGFGAGSGK